MSPLRDASDLGCAADLWPSATFLPVTLPAAWAEVLSDAASAVATGSGKSPVAGPSVEAKVEVEMADGMGWLGLWVGCRSLEPTDVYDPASEKNRVLFRDGFPTDVMSFLWQVLLNPCGSI